MGNRKAEIIRETGETKIRVSIDLDGTGQVRKIDTGIGFFDHMLDAFAKHGFFDLEVSCQGDLHVDGHHTVEDTGIVLGQAIREAAGDKKGIRRYGYMILPMDETLALCAVDLCGRPYFVFDHFFNVERTGDFETTLVREFFYAVSYGAMMNLHLKILTDPPFAPMPPMPWYPADGCECMADGCGCMDDGCECQADGPAADGCECKADGCECKADGCDCKADRYAANCFGFPYVSRGNAHHEIEALFKAFGRALDEATGMDPRIADVLSTKGTL